MIDVPVGSWAELLRRQNAAALATLSLGVGLYALNQFLVATSLPTAVIEIDGVELISWAFTVYLVPAIVGGVAAPQLKQRFGARPALFWAALAFLAGTIIASIAGSMAEVLVGRALQGLGEGIIAALCYALIPELFPARLVPRVFGVEAIVWAVAAFGGPLLAGWMTEAISWRAAFLMNVPLAALFMGFVAIVVRSGRDAGNGIRFPILRVLACATGIMLVAIANIVASPPLAAVCVAVAMLLLVSVFIIDRRCRERLFPRDAFAPTTTVGAGLWAALLMPLAHASAAVYLVMMVQELWGYGATIAGAVGAVFALSWSGSAILVAGSARHALFIRLGPLITSLGLAGLAIAIAGHDLWLLLACQIAIGAGFGVSWAFLSQAIMEAAPSLERDRASAMLPTLQSGGYAIGAATAGLVANSAGLTKALRAPEMVHASGWLFSIAAAMGALAFLASFRIRPSSITSRIS